MDKNNSPIILPLIAAMIAQSFLLAGSAKAEYTIGDAPFINTWLVIGTFDGPNAAVESITSPTEGTITDSRQWRYFDDRLFSRNLDDYQDLRSYYKIKRGESVAAKTVYTHIYVHSQTAQSAELRVGAHNEFAAWVNGSLVAGGLIGMSGSDYTREKDLSKVTINLNAGSVEMAKAS